MSQVLSEVIKITQLNKDIPDSAKIARILLIKESNCYGGKHDKFPGLAH